MFTIRDTNLHDVNSEKKVRNCFLRFSQNDKYLLLQITREHILIYNLSETSGQGTIIESAEFDEKLP